MNKNHFLASLISVIFHPLLWAFYLLVLNTFAFQEIEQSGPFLFLFIGINFLLMVLAPLAIFWLFFKFKIISSIHINERRERILPLFVMGISYYILYFLVKSMLLPAHFQIFYLGATFLVLLCMIITSFWKISIHLTAIGGTIGVIMAFGYRYQINLAPIVVALVFIAGLVGYARLKLQAHTALQIYLGFLSGAMMLFLLFILL